MIDVVGFWGVLGCFLEWREMRHEYLIWLRQWRVPRMGSCDKMLTMGALLREPLLPHSYSYFSEREREKVYWSSTIPNDILPISNNGVGW